MIQRYDLSGELYAADGGEWVAYADHVAAVAEAEQRGYTERLQEEYVLDDGDPYREAYRKGYTAGHNEAMALHQNLDVADWMYGKEPVVLRENERVINGEVYVQHGKGENP